MIVQVDTGSPITAVSNAYFRSHLIDIVKLNSTDRSFKSYVGSPIVPMGVLNVVVSYKNKKEKLELFVLPGNSAPIIGRDWLFLLGIVNSNNIYNNLSLNHVNELDSNKWIREFPEVFSDKLGVYNKKKFKIHLKAGSKPIFKKPRPVPYAMKGRIEKEIQRLVEADILAPVESSEWATPLVPVLKSKVVRRL